MPIFSFGIRSRADLRLGRSLHHCRRQRGIDLVVRHVAAAVSRNAWSASGLMPSIAFLGWAFCCVSSCHSDPCPMPW